MDTNQAQVNLADRKKASDFPQEVLNLFDLYIHGDIDRRGFMDGCKKMAIGGVTAAAMLEALRPNFAYAQQIQPTDARIKTERVTVQSPQGNGTINCYYAKPANMTGKLPAVLVIHENRGLNPYIEDVARRLATANFIALAPDGTTSVGGYPGDEQQAAQKFNSVDGTKMRQDFVAAAKWLKGHADSSGKLGAVGFCFGGGIVNFLAAQLGSDLQAGVPYYGAQVPAADTAKIKAALLLNYAGNDQRINAGWPPFEEALKANNIPHQGFIYEGTQHGFHNDTGARYDEAAAKLSWQRTLDHFNKYLRG